MPFGSLKPVCFRCSSVESLIWRKVQADEQSNKEEIICNSCSIELKKTRVYLDTGDRGGLSKGEDGQEKETNSETGSTSSKLEKDKDEQSSKQTKMLTRKSTRSKRGSNRLNLKSNQSNKGKSRRNIFKRNVSSSEISEFKSGNCENKCRLCNQRQTEDSSPTFHTSNSPPSRSQGLQIAILHLLPDDPRLGLPQRHQLHGRRHRVDGGC